MAMMRKEDSPFSGYNRKTRRRLERLQRKGRVRIIEGDRWKVTPRECAADDNAVEPQFGWFGVNGEEDFCGTMRDLEGRDSA